VHATLAREFEYKRHGTVSLLAGIDLVTGKVHALVRDRHRSREFIVTGKRSGERCDPRLQSDEPPGSSIDVPEELETGSWVVRARRISFSARTSPG
jgi:hypothetical protein